MANITELVKNIRNAILGEDVRESIAASIEQCYEDASKSGNANMEVTEARGSFDTLNKRLNNSDNILKSKRNSNEKITMGDLGQDIKEAMTGGAVAVVGKNSVQNININSRAVDERTANFINNTSTNLFNGRLHSGYCNQNGVFQYSDSYLYTDFIPIKCNEYISFLLRSIARDSSNNVFLQPYASLASFVRFLTWFDSDFNPIVGNGVINEDYSLNQSFQATDENVAYCVITISATSFEDYNTKKRIMITTSSEPYNVEDKVLFDECKYKLDNTFSPNDTFLNSINNIIDSKLNNLFSFNHENLLNPKLNKNGFIKPEGFTESVTRVYTPKILIRKGQFITLRTKNNDITNITPIRCLCFYDENNNCIQYYDNPNEIAETVQAVNGNILYCIASFSNSYNNYNGMLTVTDIDTTNDNIPFIPYNTKLCVSVDANENSLYGKKLCNFGDSIANGDNGTSYAKQIATKYSMDFLNYAHGGDTLANLNTNERGCIQNQINNFLSADIDPDYILLNGGTNDILYAELGNITSFYEEDETHTWDATKTCGGLEKILYLLKSNKPNAKIVYVIPHRMQTKNLNDQIEYFNLIRQICQKWSIPIVDIFNEGTLNTFVESMRIFTDTGTHPTTEGYKRFYVPIIEKKLKEIS